MFDIFYITNKPIGIRSKQVNSMDEAVKLSRTRYLWVADGDNDYSDFNFMWEPSPWESDQTHVWKSQWQESGGTYLIPKRNSTETNYKNEVIKRNKVTVPFIFLDFNNVDSTEAFSQISSVSNEVTKTRFISSYHGTLARIISKVEANMYGLLHRCATILTLILLGILANGNLKCCTYFLATTRSSATHFIYMYLLLKNKLIT